MLTFDEILFYQDAYYPQPQDWKNNFISQYNHKHPLEKELKKLVKTYFLMRLKRKEMKQLRDKSIPTYE